MYDEVSPLVVGGNGFLIALILFALLFGVLGITVTPPLIGGLI